jgi:PadR family transcriptional regulator
MKPSAAYIYVLTALGQGPNHGLGIADNVADFSGGEVLLGPGTLYRCLADLVADGLIERVAYADPDESPHRKYYGITPTGESRLEEDVGGLDQLVRTAKRRLRRLRAAEAT